MQDYAVTKNQYIMGNDALYEFQMVLTINYTTLQVNERLTKYNL